MLIEFSVSNYRSFWKSQTLSMAAGVSKELQKENTFDPLIKSLPSLLRSAVVYGANGSGKSNLIKALAFMQEFVLSSSKESLEGEEIRRKPFLLHSDAPSQDSEFEVVFIEDEIRFQYGFMVTDKKVTNEWLLAYPGNRPQRWFERSYNPEKKKDEWYFGPKFSGSKKVLQGATRSNALFLSTAVQLNSEQLLPVYNWFQRLVVIEHGELIEREFTAKSCEDTGTCNDILKFMKGAGVDVDDIAIKERKFEELPLPSDMPEDLKKIIQKGMQGKVIKEVFFRHDLDDSQKSVLFPLLEESDGTQKLFAYAAPWLDVLRNGRVLIVDELDNSFHPHLVRYLLNLIHNPEWNTANGQIIFSTHDTSILDTNIFRRDQIWFMEKNKNQATELYPLTDFHPRKNEALEKGYLQGRFGALPYIGDVRF
ncbi:MAG: ATP-binding protein [Desulfoprunum sp.]|nr:ATP-binding protein [Desulfoprunum sp.]